MNKKIIFAFTLVLLAIVSLASVSAADDNSTASTEINIDNTMTNDEIQAKLDTVSDNSVINFAPGEYNDVNLKVTRDKEVTMEVNETDENGTITTRNTTVTEKTTVNNVTINGNGATLIGSPENKANGYYTGIFEVANINGFTLSGFNFVCQGVKMANMMTPSCVIIFNTTNGIIEDNNISGGRFGLYVGSKFTNPNYDTIVRNNVVTDVTDMGIISFGSARTYIVNNTIIDPANHGIDVRHGSGPNCTVEGNYITGAMEGIYLMHSSGHTAINNIINHSAIGISCYGSSNIVADNNTFANNTKIGFFLGAGYSNIQIGEGNNYSGIWFTPMPPTFSYYIVKGDSSYVGATNGTFTQGDSNKNTYAVVSVLNEDGDQVNLDNGANIQIDENPSYYENITVKIWKEFDNNHIEAGEPITVTIDDEDYSGESDSTGAVYVNASSLAPGKHYMYVKYPGDDELNPCTWSAILQVGDGVKKETVIEAANMTIVTLAPKLDTSDVYFNVTLTDAEGNPLANKTIELGVNGVKYTKQTDENGVARQKINFGYQGKYTFGVAFLGDEEYNASFEVYLITVNPQTPKLTVKGGTYKASAKTKTITATFKTSKGTVIPNKKISFTVNGKTYTATTNAKGVATVKVSLSKKGTYSFTAKYAGDNTYKAISKTGKLIIK